MSRTPDIAPLAASLDHVVLTVADIPQTVEFYSIVLGMTVEMFGEGRTALHCGSQKINLHQAGREFEPKARRPMPGASDLCFLTTVPVEDVVRRLTSAGVAIELGPVGRTGAAGPITSVYVRDPDGNLVEIGAPAADTE